MKRHREYRTTTLEVVRVEIKGDRIVLIGPWRGGDKPRLRVVVEAGTYPLMLLQRAVSQRAKQIRHEARTALDSTMSTLKAIPEDA